jgi:hypothetical protein
MRADRQRRLEHCDDGYTTSSDADCAHGLLTIFSLDPYLIWVRKTPVNHRLLADLVEGLDNQRAARSLDRATEILATVSKLPGRNCS